MVDLLSVQPLPETGAWPETIARIENDWYPTGGAVNPGADEGVANWQARDLAIRTRILKDRVDQLSRGGSVQFTVGADGDFPTINDALREISSYRARYEPGGVSATIRLLPGFIMAEQVVVMGVNLGWVTIIGDDEVTQINRAALVSPQFVNRFPAFTAGDGGILPVIDHLFEMSSAGSAANRDGILVFGSGSGARVRSGKGIRRAGGDGIHLHDSATAAITGADFSMATASGLAVVNSTAAAARLVATGCGRYGVEVSSGSAVSAENATLTGCTLGGARAASGSMISLLNADARVGTGDSAGDISVGFGGTIAASGAQGGLSQTANAPTASGIIYR